MSAIISRYRPFEYSHQLTNWQNTAWNESRTCSEVAMAVVKIALAYLVFPFVFLIDIVFTAYRKCNPAPIERAPVAEISAPLPPAGAIPDPGFVQSVLANPYPFSRIHGHDTFLNDALEAALKLNSPETTALYIQLIRTRGRPEEGREAPIDIYKWAAGCLLAHYLVAKEHNCEINYFYPHGRRGYLPVEPFRVRNFNAEPEVDEHGQAMSLLLREYMSLTRENKTAALLQIMVPSTQWRLGLVSQRFFNQMNDRAQRMAEDPLFRGFFEFLSRRI